MEAYCPNEDGSELIKQGCKLRVGDELDKLASNIAMFRNAADVHYRSDAEVGIELLLECDLSVPQKKWRVSRDKQQRLISHNLCEMFTLNQLKEYL
jgi:hypothetical protein